MPYLESLYHKTLLKDGLAPHIDAQYRRLFNLKTQLHVLNFVDGFHNRFSGDWYLLAELDDGSFGLYLEIMEFYENSANFAPVHSGVHLYHPCARKDAEKVLVDALNDYEEEHAYDLANELVAQGKNEEANEVRQQLSKTKQYLRERLNGEDEENARSIVAMTHAYD